MAGGSRNCWSGREQRLESVDRARDAREHNGLFIRRQLFPLMAFPRKEQGIALTAFDVDKDVPRLDWIHQILDATDSDLTRFRDRKSKLLMYFGWADQSLNAQMGVDYYESAMQKMGPQTRDFFRLFMQPGVFHCGGGV